MAVVASSDFGRFFFGMKAERVEIPRARSVLPVVAGSGSAGVNGDKGQAFSGPSSVAVGAARQ